MTLNDLKGKYVRATNANGAVLLQLGATRLGYQAKLVSIEQQINYSKSDVFFICDNGHVKWVFGGSRYSVESLGLPKIKLKTSIS